MPRVSAKRAPQAWILRGSAPIYGESATLPGGGTNGAFLTILHNPAGVFWRVLCPLWRCRSRNSRTVHGVKGSGGA